VTKWTFPVILALLALVGCVARPADPRPPLEVQSIQLLTALEETSTAVSAPTLQSDAALIATSRPARSYRVTPGKGNWFRVDADAAQLGVAIPHSLAATVYAVSADGQREDFLMFAEDVPIAPPPASAPIGEGISSAFRPLELVGNPPFDLLIEVETFDGNPGVIAVTAVSESSP